MKQVKINSNKYNQIFAYCFNTQEEVDKYLADIAANGMYGLPDRKNLVTHAIHEINEYGETIEVSPAIYETLTAEYSVEVTDLSQTYDYQLQQCYLNRQKAYPPVADYLDAIVKGDEQQKQDYINKCLAVKLRFPKPVRSV